MSDLLPRRTVDPWERTTGARLVKMVHETKQIAVQCPAPTRGGVSL
jgi:hypothetical protein